MFSLALALHLYFEVAEAGQRNFKLCMDDTWLQI